MTFLTTAFPSPKIQYLYAYDVDHYIADTT
jgi:hypothetical protein